MIKRLLRRHLSAGVYRALQNIAYEVRVSRMHRRALRKAAKFRGKKGLKLHVGCGRNIKAEFINIDLEAAADLTLDLRESLPFEGESCAVIYSEHFIEHIPYPEGILKFLSECLRVLQPDGVFSAGVPNTEALLLEYAGVTRGDLFAVCKERWHPEWCETRMEQINYHFRQGEEHKFAYDEETFHHILKRAGFTNVRLREYDPQLDQATWSDGTLFVEARKPPIGA